MKLLEDKIKAEGKIFPGNVLKVDSFINHLMDTALIDKLALEIKRRFAGEKITKVLTVEASGIGIAYAVARVLKVPLLFAKKNQTSNISKTVYSAPVVSYTHGKTYNIVVSKDYLTADDSVLIIDDFLALGNALEGLLSLISQAGANCVGAGIIIEKGFQGGGDKLRARGIRIESLAIVESMTDDGQITFRKTRRKKIS